MCAAEYGTIISAISAVHSCVSEPASYYPSKMFVMALRRYRNWCIRAWHHGVQLFGVREDLQQAVGCWSVTKH